MIPVLKFDENSDFLLDFIWQNIISEINKRRWVKNKIELNRRKIETVFHRLWEESDENEHFKRIEEQVKYYYPNLKGDVYKGRVVVHYIATLTDAQINSICRR